MINQQLKEKYNNELTSLTITYPNIVRDGIGGILYRKIQRHNPYFKQDVLGASILRRSTIRKEVSQIQDKLRFTIVYPKDRRWFKQSETTIDVKQIALKDYLTAFDIVDYKYDVKQVDTLREVVNSGVFGPFKCTELDTYYDRVIISLDKDKLNPLPDNLEFTKTEPDTLFHLIASQEYRLHFVRSEKRDIDKESNPTTIFRGDGVVKIPSEALIIPRSR